MTQTKVSSPQVHSSDVISTNSIEAKNTSKTFKLNYDASLGNKFCVNCPPHIANHSNKMTMMLFPTASFGSVSRQTLSCGHACVTHEISHSELSSARRNRENRHDRMGKVCRPMEWHFTLCRSFLCDDAVMNLTALQVHKRTRVN